MESYEFECFLTKNSDGSLLPIIAKDLTCGRRIEMYCGVNGPCHDDNRRFPWTWIGGEYVEGFIEHDGNDYYFKSIDGKHDFHGDLTKRLFRISRNDCISGTIDYDYKTHKHYFRSDDGKHDYHGDISVGRYYVEYDDKKFEPDDEDDL